MVRLSPCICVSIVVLLLCIEGKKHLACHHQKLSKQHHLLRRESNSSDTSIAPDTSSPNKTLKQTAPRHSAEMKKKHPKKGSLSSRKKKSTRSKRVEHNRLQRKKNQHRTTHARKKRSAKRTYQSCRNPMQREIVTCNTSSVVKVDVRSNGVFDDRLTKSNIARSSKSWNPETKRRSRSFDETFDNSSLVLHEHLTDYSSNNKTITNLGENSKETKSSTLLLNDSKLLHSTLDFMKTSSHLNISKQENANILISKNEQKQIVPQGNFHRTDNENLNIKRMTISTNTSTNGAEAKTEIWGTTVYALLFDGRYKNNSTVKYDDNNIANVKTNSQLPRSVEFSNKTATSEHVTNLTSPLAGNSYESRQTFSFFQNETEFAKSTQTNKQLSAQDAKKPLDDINKLFIFMSTNLNSTAVSSNSDNEEAALSHIAEAPQVNIPDKLELSSKISSHSPQAHTDLSSLPERQNKINPTGNDENQSSLAISEKPENSIKLDFPAPNGTEKYGIESVNSSRVDKRKMSLMDFEGPFILKDVDTVIDQSSLHIRVKRNKPEKNVDFDAASEESKSNYPFDKNERNPNRFGDLASSTPQNYNTTDPRTSPEMKTGRLFENSNRRTSNVTYAKEFPILQNTSGLVAVKELQFGIPAIERLSTNNFRENSDSITTSNNNRRIIKDYDSQSASKNTKTSNDVGSEPIENISHWTQLHDFYPHIVQKGVTTTATLVRKKRDTSDAKSFDDQNYDYSNVDIDDPEEAGSIRKKRALSNMQFLVDDDNDRLHADPSNTVISLDAETNDSEHQLPIVDKSSLANKLSDLYPDHVGDPIYQTPAKQLLRKKRLADVQNLLTNDKSKPLSLSQYNERNGYNAYGQNNENGDPSVEKSREFLESYPEDNSIIDSMLSKVEYDDPDDTGSVNRRKVSSQQFSENLNSENSDIAPSLHSMLYDAPYKADSDLYDAKRISRRELLEDVENPNMINAPEDSQSSVELSILQGNVPLRNDHSDPSLKGKRRRNSMKQGITVDRQAYVSSKSKETLHKHSVRHTKTETAMDGAVRDRESRIRSRRSIEKRSAAEAGDEKSVVTGEHFSVVSGDETKLNKNDGITPKIENLSKGTGSLEIDPSGLTEDIASSKIKCNGNNLHNEYAQLTLKTISSDDDRPQIFDNKKIIAVMKGKTSGESRENKVLTKNDQLKSEENRLLNISKQVEIHPHILETSNETSKLNMKESDQSMVDEQVDRRNIASNVQMQIESYAQFMDNEFESQNDKDLSMISPHDRRLKKSVNSNDYFLYDNDNFAERNNANENKLPAVREVWNVVDSKSNSYQGSSSVKHNDQRKTNSYKSSNNDKILSIVKRDTARLDSDRKKSLSTDEQSDSSVSRRAAPSHSNSQPILSTLNIKRNTSSRELVQPERNFHHQQNLSPRHGLSIKDKNLPVTGFQENKRESSIHERLKRHEDGCNSDITSILGQHCQGSSLQEVKYYDDVREPIPSPQQEFKAQPNPWEKLRNERAVKSVDDIKELMEKLVAKVDDLQKYMGCEHASNKRDRKRVDSEEVNLNRTSNNTDGSKVGQSILKELKNDAVKRRGNARLEFQAKKNEKQAEDRRMEDPSSQKRSIGALRSQQWWKRGRKKRKSRRKWDRWTDWSSCSVTCGKGRQIRWRHCIHECTIAETEMEEKACQLPACGPGKFLGIF